MFKNHRVTTKDLYIGKPEAEAENIMHNGRVKPFFEDFLHIDKQVNDNGCFIIAGRKGSGKSAYAVQLQTQAEKTNSKLFCELIKKDEFDLEAAMQSLSSSVDLKYEALFEWIILTRLVKLVINSKEGQHVSQVKALREFYRKNAGMVEINKYVVAEILVNKEVNFSPLIKKPAF